MPLPDFNALPQAVPRFIEPMYAKPVQSLPEGDEWLYEVKLDGYRCLAGRTLKGVTLWSRRGNVITEQFPNVAHAAEALAADTLVDGEVVALDENGRISFNVLQHHRSNAQALQFYAFDLLMYRGRSLRNVPLLGRRELLAKALRDAIHGSASVIRLSENFTARAIDLIRSAQELALEGIIAKKKLSTYESGKRTGAWVKYKTQKSEEFVVGGYTAGTPFDALVVGCYQNGKLLFVAKVRNGFVPHVRREVFAKFKGLETDICPFANLPERKRTQWALTVEGMKECRWLRPELVAQIAFTEWTPDGHLREASFVGLRDDKSAEEMLRD
jgi:DNA ligase D-like protein (predicted ligase)